MVLVILSIIYRSCGNYLPILWQLFTTLLKIIYLSCNKYLPILWGLFTYLVTIIHLSCAPNTVPVHSWPHASPAMYRLEPWKQMFMIKLQLPQVSKPTWSNPDDSYWHNMMILNEPSHSSVHVFIQCICDSSRPVGIGTKEKWVPEKLFSISKFIWNTSVQG